MKRLAASFLFLLISSQSEFKIKSSLYDRMLCEVQEDISIQNHNLLAHDIMLATATQLSSFHFHVSDISE